MCRLQVGDALVVHAHVAHSVDNNDTDHTRLSHVNIMHISQDVDDTGMTFHLATFGQN